MHSFPIRIGAYDQQKKIDGLINPLQRRIELNFAEFSTLAETRDLLLPKLMSGEIRLREAEKVVEDAV